jgi:hypothetical protein
MEWWEDFSARVFEGRRRNCLSLKRLVFRKSRRVLFTGRSLARREN